MAGERTVNVGLCRVTGHSSRIRRTLFDLLPFWQGATPSFELTIEATIDIEHQLDFLYTIRSSNNLLLLPPMQLQMSPIRAKEKRKFKLSPLPLLYTGDSFLVVGEIINKKTQSYETVYVFHTTSRTWFGLALLAGFLAGAFATLGHWIISFI